MHLPLRYSRNTIQRRQHFQKDEIFAVIFSRKCATEDVPGINKYSVNCNSYASATIVRIKARQHRKRDDFWRQSPRKECNGNAITSQHQSLRHQHGGYVVSCSARRRFCNSRLVTCAGDVSSANMFYQALLLHSASTVRLASTILRWAMTIPIITRRLTSSMSRPITQIITAFAAEKMR